MYIHQLTETADPGQGGRASYRFNITTSGDYVVKMVVDAPHTGANSVFVNVDSEPANSDTIWNIPMTQGFEERTVSWRGSDSPSAAEFAPQVFALSAGEHELIIRGSEKDACVDAISLVYLGSSPPDKTWSVLLPFVRRD